MDYITTKQASEILSVTSTRIAVFIRDGRLPAEKISGVWLIKKADLNNFACRSRPKGWKKVRPRKLSISK
jgi:excisionase family DNA binding protein